MFKKNKPSNFFGKFSLPKALLVSALLSGTATRAQIVFSSAGSSTTAAGPTVAGQSATMYISTGTGIFLPALPTTTATITLSNQQFTSIPVGTGGSAGTATGLSIGETSIANTKSVTGALIYNRMSTIGAPSSNSFTATRNFGAGIGIDVANNYAFDLYTTPEGLASFNNGGTPPFLEWQAPDSRPYYYF